MGNDISTSNNYSSVQNDLINEIKNTLNTDTETFRPKKQQGGIVWNPKDIFITHEGLRGEVIKKRMEPDLVHKNVYEVKVNGRLETMWPESNMIEPPEVKTKREEAVQTRNLKEEEERKKQTEQQKVLDSQRDMHVRQQTLADLQKTKQKETELKQKIAVEEQKIRKLTESKQSEHVITSQRQKSTSTIQGLTQELKLVNQQIATLEKQ
jgi:hypothetical protein